MDIASYLVGLHEEIASNDAKIAAATEDGDKVAVARYERRNREVQAEIERLEGGAPVDEPVEAPETTEGESAPEHAVKPAPRKRTAKRK